jgi:hypothetical protein
LTAHGSAVDSVGLAGIGTGTSDGVEFGLEPVFSDTSGLGLAVAPDGVGGAAVALAVGVGDDAPVGAVLVEVGVGVGVAGIAPAGAVAAAMRPTATTAALTIPQDRHASECRVMRIPLWFVRGVSAADRSPTGRQRGCAPSHRTVPVMASA